MRRARKAARRASAWLKRRARRAAEAHGLILMYHRVATASVDPWRLCVSPANFDAQMRVLRGSCDVVPLLSLRARLRKGRHSRPVAAVTFDDGYLDNLATARPILERHGIPATVFVITGYTGRQGAFWWDALSAAILGAATLPTHIRLSGEGTPFECEDAALGQGDTAGAAARRVLHERLWSWLVDRPDPERTTALAAIVQWSGTHSVAESLQRPMNADELRELTAGGLIELGAHTRTHPRLSRLATAARTEEISRSREDLRRILGDAPRCFSYPNGDYDAASAGLVRQAGFALACDSRQDLVWASGDAHAMPRISVRDESGTAFARRLGWDLLA